MHFHGEVYISAKFKLFHFCQQVRRCAAVVAATRQVDISLFYKSSQNRDSISATRSDNALWSSDPVDVGMTQWLSWSQNGHVYGVRFWLQFCKTNKAWRHKTTTVSSFVTGHVSVSDTTLWMILQYEWHYSMNDTTVWLTVHYEWHYSMNDTIVWIKLQYGWHYEWQYSVNE